MRATFNVADYFAGDVEESALSDGHLENTIVSGSLNGGVEPEFFSDLFIAPEPASGILLLFAFALLLAVKPLRARIISGCR
ncbi:MAG TPA: hypothetical protein VG297_11595 [Bryobacteraceae bacterium]|jgi:hypothetical protein|nr:hypothetical protein [Bryobacteraceae bacterium]